MFDKPTIFEEDQNSSKESKAGRKGTLKEWKKEFRVDEKPGMDYNKVNSGTPEALRVKIQKKEAQARTDGTDDREKTRNSRQRKGKRKESLVFYRNFGWVFHCFSGHRIHI